MADGSQPAPPVERQGAPDEELDEDLGRTPPGPLLAVAGLGIAALSSMCGIGGGLFAVPILHYVFGVPLKRAVATALCLVWCVAVSATISEALHPGGALYPGVVVALVCGSLVGAQLGFRLAQRLRTRALKTVFCVVLSLVGAKIIAMSGGAAPIADATYRAAGSDLAIAVGIGLVAGVAVPLLGVGGGLIVVPALLLVLPQVGFFGARAASLAMAIVSSSRSLWLYHGQRKVDWRSGAWFGVGAAGGAVLGVQLAHRTGGAIGQVLLGVVLLFAATRFGWDVFRTRSAVRGSG